MIKLGIIYRVIDDETLQIKDLDDGELYEVKGDINSIADIKEAFPDGKITDDKLNDYLVEYDDEMMEITN